MALSLDSVGFTYPVAADVVEPALADVSVKVDVGELTLVLGATGSGKSTLLRMASGLLEPSWGAVAIDGEPLTRARARGAVGLVFQDAEAQLFAETVLDDVAFGPANLGASKADAQAAAREALQRVGLSSDEFASRSPFGLSGGEARRAAIAGVLAMSPRYLLMDEPTAGLDARGRLAVRAIIAAERERCGVAIVSHSAVEFLGEADRVVLLTSGRVTFSGRAQELIARPRAFADAGLLAPDVLRVQELAAERGVQVGEYRLDPEGAAEVLASAGGWR